MKGPEKSFKPQLLFLGGFPSGGTDLLKNVLNAHPDVYINGEMPFLFGLQDYGISSDFRITSKQDLIKLKHIIEKYDIWGNVDNIINIHFSQCNGYDLESFFYKSFNDQNKRIWGNKTPQNTENINSLKKYFPSAKFIIIVRDIRDICLSWKNKWGKSMYLSAHKWNTRMNFNSENNNILMIHFEELLINTEMVTKKICLFLNIDWNNRMLSYEKYTSKIIDGKINYGQRIIPKNKNKWETELTTKEIERIEEISYETLIKFGYKIRYAEKHKKITLHEMFNDRLRDTYAMLFIGNRHKIENSFRRRLTEIYNQVKIRLR